MFLSIGTARNLIIFSRPNTYVYYGNQFFGMSQLYIHENLVRIQPLIYKILCRQESGSDANADADSNGIHTKINMSPSS